MKKGRSRKWKRLLSLALAFVMTLSLCLPATASAAQGDKPAKPAITDVVLAAGDESRLKVLGWYEKTTWACDNEAVATVSEDGTMQAVAEGMAKVTAESYLFRGRYKNRTVFQITVTKAEPLRVDVGGTLALKVGLGRSVKWATSDAAVAKVAPDGVVTGISEGNVTITATVNNSRYPLILRWGNIQTTTVHHFQVSVEDFQVVTFETNGGSAVDPQYVKTGEAAQRPENPTKEGFYLQGWYTDAELTNVYDFSQPVNEDLTLYAKWGEGSEETAMPDIDSDKVDDRLEEMFGTDPNKDDTDQDGLSDFAELTITSTSPTMADTDNNGTADGEEDLDNDGLTNLQEVAMGTDPGKADSDVDTLPDGEEVERGTDPTKEDTDADGISDPVEIKLGLDPLNPCTDGKTPDGERTFAQTLEGMDESLNVDNAMVPTISGEVTDNIQNHVAVHQSMNETVVSNRAVVGKPVQVETDYPEGTALNLTFQAKEGDSRLPFYVVCKYEDNTFLPQETTVEGSCIRANVGQGEYFVLDAEKFLMDLDIPITKYKGTTPVVAAVDEAVSVATYAAPDSDPEDPNYQPSDSKEDLSDKKDDKEDRPVVTMDKVQPMTAAPAKATVAGQADVVFVIDSTGSMGEEINNVANNINNFVDALQARNVRANFALVDYKDITCSGEETRIVGDAAGNIWFRDSNEYKDAIRNLYVHGGGDGPETAVDAMGAAVYDTGFRPAATKFVVLVTDADYKTDNNYGLSSMQHLIDVMRMRGIITSVITSSGYEPTYHDLYTQTEGVYGDIYSDFATVLLTLADRIGQEADKGDWVILSDYEIIQLEGELNATNGIDTDKDYLNDWEELDKPETRDMSPFIKTCLKEYGVPEEEYKDAKTVQVYAYDSHPLRPDTDFDGIGDLWDKFCKEGYFEGTMGSHLDYMGAHYVMDFRDFFARPEIYNAQLATTSLIMANQMYGGENKFMYRYGTNKEEAATITDLMKLHGFEDVAEYSLEHGIMNDWKGFEVDTYTDDDISELAIGHHKVSWNGQIKTVVGIFIRGTDSSISEWSSNFDMGPSTNAVSPYHKGFRVTEQRLLNFVDRYLETELPGVDHLCFWLSGHSRGAALANLMAGDMVDRGEETFAYTFATPASYCGASSTSSKYAGLYNICNSGDLVPNVPLAYWNFRHFGKTLYADMDGAGFQKAWKKGMGKDYIGPSTATIQDVLLGLSALAADRDQVYAIDYDGEQDISKEQARIISWRARKYCELKDKDIPIVGLRYDLYPSTAFVMQLAAELLQGEDQTAKDHAGKLIKEFGNTVYGDVLIGTIGIICIDKDGLYSGHLDYDFWHPIDSIKNGAGSAFVNMHCPSTYYAIVSSGTYSAGFGGGGGGGSSGR